MRYASLVLRYMVLGTWYLTVSTSPSTAQNDQLSYEVDPDFFQLPDGWNFGPTPGAARTPDGYGNSRVVKYTSDGEYVTEWGGLGSDPGQFNLPHTIYVDSDDRVWVGDRNNHRIQIFDTDGALLEVWDDVGYPWGFAPSSDGNVWMADGTTDRVVKLDLAGEILRSFGGRGRSSGRLGWVHYLTELRDGSLIVAEIVSQRASRYVESETDGSGSGQFVFAWAGDDKGGDSDFLAVVDSDPTSDRYGEVLTTLPVGVSESMPHHTEHRMPEGDTLFANDFRAGKTYLFDLSDPLNPEIAGSFENAGKYTFPHSFERLPNGNVLSTFQTVGEGNQEVGGLVELDPTGAFVRGASAADPDVEFVRPYSLAILPELDRVVSTSTDMKGSVESWHVQVWRLSDLSRIKTIALPQGARGDEQLYPGEPRVTDNGTVVVTTFRCGVYRIDGVEGEDPTAVLVYTHEYVEGYECALATAIGNFVVQTVPAIGGLVSLDFSDPVTPLEAGRIEFGPGLHPHWIASSSNGRRIVISGYRALAGRLLIVDFDRTSGRMALDELFSDKGSIFPGVSFRRDHWPHGTTRDAIPHGVVFSRE
ncbi:MAG: hypothetical protein ACC655_05200 [Rhodothermia bacterium]